MDTPWSMGHASSLHPTLPVHLMLAVPHGIGTIKSALNAQSTGSSPMESALLSQASARPITARMDNAKAASKATI
jgi:hypothetical protein